MADVVTYDIVKYIKEIGAALIGPDSVHDDQRTHIREQFVQFGLDNTTYAQAVVQVEVQIAQVISGAITQSALELIKLEEERPLLDAKIKLAENELELKDKDLAIKDRELKLKDKQLTMMDKELAIKEQELRIREEELKIAKQELELKKQMLAESKAKTELIKEQTKTERLQQGMLKEQTGLVARQTDGYDDNLMVKAAEYQGGLASFAVNSGANSANAAIREFNRTIAELKRRAKYGTR